jgi:aquaporin Z
MSPRLEGFRGETPERPRHRISGMNIPERHWPEYAIDGLCLGLFMLSATTFATLLQHPSSPVSRWLTAPIVQRIPMGVAMGLTAAAIIYSPLGRRSGAHMNPALTLTFLRLGKVTPIDALGYIAGQFAGGAAGIVAAVWLLRGLPADPSVNFMATTPGPEGWAVAFLAEAVISFGMMLMVLTATNTSRLAPFTGLFAGALVATYITFEAPLSGMSMNPARSLGPSVLARQGASLWIYFVAPTVGMFAAAEVFVRRRGPESVGCAKLHHPKHGRCIFGCRASQDERVRP